MDRALLPASFAIMVVTLGLAAAGCDTTRYVEAFEPEGDVERVRLEVDQGTVVLEPGERVWVERGIRAAQGTLELSHEVEDGTLVLRASCTTPIPCAVDTVVTVPGGVPVEIAMGEGSVSAHGVGELSVSLSEGEADLQVRGDLTAQVGKGSLQVDLSETSSGNLVVGSGNIALSVPDTRWGLDLSAEDVVLQGVQDAPESAASIAATAPGGRIEVVRVDSLATR